VPALALSPRALDRRRWQATPGPELRSLASRTRR